MRLRAELTTGFLDAARKEAALAFGPPNSWGGGFLCGGTRSPCPEWFGANPAQRSGSGSSPPIRYANGGYSFTPDAARFFDPLSSTAEDWAVAWNVGHERMITRETWYNLEHHQLGVLRREGRLLVVAAARTPVLLSSPGSAKATLAMGRPADLHVEGADAPIDPGGVARARLELEDGGWLASLEVTGEDWAGRVRYGASAPVLADGFGVSDPVLFDARFGDDAVPLPAAMLPSTDLTGHPRVGVLFEVYGAEEDEPLRIAVSAERTGLSLLQRAAGALRLRPSATLEVGWTEPARSEVPGVFSKRLIVDLGGLGEGRYRLTVQVARPNGATATSQRTIRRARAGG